MYFLLCHRYLHSPYQETLPLTFLPRLIHPHHSDLNLETGTTGPVPAFGSLMHPVFPHCEVYHTSFLNVHMSSPLDCKLNGVGDQACILHQWPLGPGTGPDIQSEVLGGGGVRKRKKSEMLTKERTPAREGSGGEGRNS